MIGYALNELPVRDPIFWRNFMVKANIFGFVIESIRDVDLKTAHGIRLLLERFPATIFTLTWPNILKINHSDSQPRANILYLLRRYLVSAPSKNYRIECRCQRGESHSELTPGQ